MKKTTKSIQVNKNISKMVRVDSELHHLLKISASKEKTTIKALVEGLIVSYLGTEKWK